MTKIYVLLNISSPCIMTKKRFAEIQCIFIYKASVTVKNVSSCFTETQELTPQQATGARNNSPLKGRNLEHDQAHVWGPSC